MSIVIFSLAVDETRPVGSRRNTTFNYRDVNQSSVCDFDQAVRVDGRRAGYPGASVSLRRFHSRDLYRIPVRSDLDRSHSSRVLLGDAPRCRSESVRDAALSAVLTLARNMGQWPCGGYAASVRPSPYCSLIPFVMIM